MGLWKGLIDRIREWNSTQQGDISEYIPSLLDKIKILQNILSCIYEFGLFDSYVVNFIKIDQILSSPALHTGFQTENV